MAQLGNVCADPQAVLRSGIENGLCFLRAEGASFRKYVHKLCQFSLRGAGNHFVADEVDVLLRASLELLWDNMGTKQRWDNGPCPMRCGVPNCLKRLQLRFRRKAVTGFGLDGR